MDYTYLIMDESKRSERPRRLELGADDYCIRYTLGEDGVELLKRRCHTDAERAYIEKYAKSLAKMDWAYNMVYLMEQACGHIELFQTQVKNEKQALDWLALMEKIAGQRKCTRCTCGL